MNKSSKRIRTNLFRRGRNDHIPSPSGLRVLAYQEGLKYLYTGRSVAVLDSHVSLASFRVPFLREFRTLRRLFEVTAVEEILSVVYGRAKTDFLVLWNLTGTEQYITHWRDRVPSRHCVRRSRKGNAQSGEKEKVCRFDDSEASAKRCDLLPRPCPLQTLSPSPPSLLCLSFCCLPFPSISLFFRVPSPPSHSNLFHSIPSYPAPRPFPSPHLLQSFIPSPLSLSSIPATCVSSCIQNEFPFAVPINIPVLWDWISLENGHCLENNDTMSIVMLWATAKSNIPPWCCKLQNHYVLCS